MPPIRFRLNPELGTSARLGEDVHTSPPLLKAEYIQGKNRVMDRSIPNAYLLFVRYENRVRLRISARRDKPDRAQDIMPYQTP
jgi:hypothetical protein